MNNQFIPWLIGAAFSFVDKVISSFGSLIIGAILIHTGIVSITETPLSQTIFWTVLSMYFGLPAIGHLFSSIATRFCPLDKRAHGEMLAARDARDGVPAAGSAMD